MTGTVNVAIRVTGRTEPYVVENLPPDGAAELVAALTAHSHQPGFTVLHAASSTVHVNRAHIVSVEEW